MNRHALEVLQFPQALDLVAGFATSPLGAERVRQLTATDSTAWIDGELGRVAEVMHRIGRGAEWAVPGIPDCMAALRRLAMDGAVLDAPELRDLANLMQASAQAKAMLRSGAEDLPLMTGLTDRLHTFERDEKEIRHAVDDHGEVRDHASKDLSRLRREIRGARSSIVEKLERYAASLPARFQVADASVTLRDGRFVIPVRREGRTEVGGLVHDESATGQTLFIEPPVAIELMNRLRELEIAEAREVQRILRELSDAIRPAQPLLSVSLDSLVELDSVHARATYALRYDGVRPTVLDRADRTYDVVHGRHPILLAGGGDVVPFDLRLDPGECTVLLSGPNTGGKTVLLKAVGLISAMTQSGIVPPVGPGTRLPIFGDMFADIGDEQSIEASLSTFSAHLRNLREIIEDADSESLVLIDEMGSGTDPVEGAALAKSIVIELTRRGAVTIATTHLGALKQVATEESGVVNASLDFDSKALRPTYRLRKGVPGRSYGLAIARRLGFPATVLERADAYVPESERTLATLLAEVEQKEAALTVALEDAERARSAAQRLEIELDARTSALEAKERSAERRSRQQARDLLLSARSDVEAAIHELRDAMAAATTEEERNAAVRVARRRVEERASAQARQVRRVRSEAREHDGAGTISEGDRVRIEATGASGTVVEVRDERAVVDVGGVRLHVAASGLVRVTEPVAQKPATASAHRGGWSSPDFDAASEVDLRGMRADEAISRLQSALDAAIQAALPNLRIIHGKGTGALREVVADELRSDGRVSSFRAGGLGEGGTGVTVAELR